MPPSAEVLFTFVLHFYQGQPATFFLTLAESVTLDAPHYLFIFRPRVTAPDIAVVLEATSANDRSEQFDLDPDTVFADAPLGQYSYIVYEQDSAENTDPANATGELERGIAHLHREVPFAFVQRATTTQFIQP